MAVATAVAGGLLIAAAALHAQFASGVTLVEVYATVTTRDGRIVTDLPRDAFVVREDGVPQSIQTFAAGEFPLSVALAIDRSWSMAGKPLTTASAAARRFLLDLRPGDDAMVIGVSSEVETLAPLSRDRAAQVAAVEGITPWGSTKLHDAIAAAHERITGAPGRRALVIMSDGRDRGSEISADAVIDRVRASDVLVYPVILGDSNSPLLAQLAAFSGGRAFWTKRPEEIASAFGGIARELRHQFLIGYAPTPSARQGRRWHRIQVEVPGRADLRVRARPGYFSE